MHQVGNQRRLYYDARSTNHQAYIGLPETCTVCVRPGLGFRAGDSVVNYAHVSVNVVGFTSLCSAINRSPGNGGSPPTLYLSEITKADLVWLFKATESTMCAQAAAVTTIIMNTNRLEAPNELSCEL